MLVGYARVSTADQDLALQLDALETAGCERVFEERASGARSDRPVLAEAMDYVREGDVLVVWRRQTSSRLLQRRQTPQGSRGVGEPSWKPSW